MMRFHCVANGSKVCCFLDLMRLSTGLVWKFNWLAFSFEWFAGSVIALHLLLDLIICLHFCVHLILSSETGHILAKKSFIPANYCNVSASISRLAHCCLIRLLILSSVGWILEVLWCRISEIILCAISSLLCRLSPPTYYSVWHHFLSVIISQLLPVL
mgnify:CR=1 FL=1